jgi:hypothetical protein
MLVLVFLVIAVMSCKDPDGCEPEITKCEGNAVFICNTEKNWEKSMSCDEASVAGLVFKCEMVPETGDHECVLKSGDVPFDTAFDTMFDTDYGWDMDSGDASADGGFQ